jgi:FkbM family methyltransferase
MNSIIERIITRLRVSLFPTQEDKEYKRWLSDGGDEKLRYDYDLNSDSIIMDIGGYKGQWASDIYARYNCRILVFEPVKSFAVTIEERFKKNPKIEVFGFALGARRRQETLFLSDDASSLYKTTGIKETIQFENVSEFFTKHNIKRIDLMKINIEGGEYELMPTILEKGLINKIRHIQIQFHNVGADSEENMKAICRDLSKTHKPSYQYKFVWENWDRYDICAHG